MKGLARLRMVNAVLSVAMLVLFAVHGIGNGLQLMGPGLVQSKAIALALLAVTLAHTVIGVILTVVTLRTQREAGISYFRENKRFWAVRISGLAIVVFILLHVAIFWQSGGGMPRLTPFEGFQLVVSILLVASIAVHVLANMQPMMISLGIGSPRGRAVDAAVVLAVILLFTAAAFAIYYLRWMVV